MEEDELNFDNNEGDNNDDSETDDSDSDDEEQTIHSELVQIRMPSTVIIDYPNCSPELRKLADQELQLREGQANDALRKLRLAIGHKTILFKEHVRKAKTTATRTRAWTAVKGVEDRIKEHAAIYRLARATLPSLGAKPDMLEIYKELKEEHLQVSEDISDENRTYQRNHTLPWIWRINGHMVEDGDDWMTEC